jgi:hypothetical protein
MNIFTKIKLPYVTKFENSDVDWVFTIFLYIVGFLVFSVVLPAFVLIAILFWSALISII